MVIVNLTGTMWRAVRLMRMCDGRGWRYYDATMYDDVNDALERAAALNVLDEPDGGWYVAQVGVGK